MRLSAPFLAAGRAAGRWRDALIDPARREGAVFVSLALYVLLWTAYGTIAKSSQGLHPDMTEVIAWSRDLSLGYFKHPPLAAWVVWLWFAVFPVAEWSYYLLAMLMPAIALWIVWRISADYLAADKRIIGLALLTFVPFFNFHALKFNVNTVLIPLWAATTWFFLMSVRTRSPVWAALAGVAAAGAMLGKYWSVFLLAGLVMAAVVDERRAAYFRSSAPWITIVAGFAALAPHAIWLPLHDFAPFSYATIVHGVKPFTTVFLGALGYIVGGFGYVAVPLIVTLAIARPNGKMLADIGWPRETERRLVAVAFWAPLLLPGVGAVIGRTEITSLWSMSSFTLLPVLLLSSPLLSVKRIEVTRVLLAAAAFPMVMLIASPVIAAMAQRAGPPPASAQASLLSLEVERLWYQSTPRPLRLVGGDADLAYGVATYAADRPRPLTGLSALPASEVSRDGLVWLCFAEDAACREEAAIREGLGGKRFEMQIVRNFFRIPGKPQRYTIVVLPPRP